jgi:glycosyltransferase involved in cell wall biosynthesis
MMHARGHEVIHYGHEDSVVDCSEHVTVVTNKDLEIAYGNYDWRKNFFKHDVNDHAHQVFCANAIREINKRKRKTDILLPFWGVGLERIYLAEKDSMIVIEPGIGYPAVATTKWKIFESYAIYHAYYGMPAVGKCMQDWYHVVIPNYFDPEDFTYSDKKDDYFLFLGRVYPGKGVDIAIQVTQALGKKLIIAGQTDGSIKFPEHVEYVGYADTEKRRTLMSKATASFIPSLYLEPFAGVSIENLFSGTPIITTDWGAFTEYNTHGVTGYRCRTYKDFVEAAQNVHKIEPAKCRQVAENYSLEAIAPRYERFFQDVLNVYEGEGWYQL